jgi:elongation factor Ts
MAVTLEQIKKLRTMTGAGITIVKEALESSNGDMDKAIIYLREKGVAKGAKRADRSAPNGYICSYIHGEGSIGVLIELNSETDFAARDEKFRALAKEIALHVAASNPEYISIESIPADVIEKLKEEASKDIDEKKPQEIKEKIVEGKIQRFYEDSVLLEQKYFKDETKTIKDLINDTVAAISEKIEVGRMCRFQLAQPSTFRTL